MEREKVIEIFLALIFIVLVFTMVLVGLNIGASKTTSKTISNSYNNVDNSKTYYENNVVKETAKIVKKSSQKTHYYVENQGKTLVKAYNKDPYSSKTLVKAYYGEKKLVKKKTYVKDYDKKYYKSYNKGKKYYYYNNYEPKKDYVWDWDEWDERSYSKDYDHFGKHTKDKSWGFDTDTYRVYVYNDGPGDYFKVKFYFEDCWGGEKTYDMRKYVGHDDENIFYFRDINSEPDKYCDWRYEVSH